MYRSFRLTMMCQVLAAVAGMKATLAATENKKADLEAEANNTTDQLK